MEQTLLKPVALTSKSNSKPKSLLYWSVTALFCAEMLFTAYYELLPQGAEAFARLGFPAGYFRVELSLAKLVGVAVLLLPLFPARLKEWCYAGFAINLGSALVAHLSLGEGPKAWMFSAMTSALWVLSYLSWRRPAAPAV